MVSSRSIEHTMLHTQTEKPNIITDSNGNYVIIGVIDHGHQIPEDAIMEVIDSLDDVVALKMEAIPESRRGFHPMSTEIITLASIGSAPVSYLPHEDGSEIIKYVSEELAELYVPHLMVRMLDRPLESEEVIRGLKQYKQLRFGFIDTERGFHNYVQSIRYWMENDLDLRDLDHFSYDFEGFVGSVRQFELWSPDLRTFQKDNPGKIAVCVGDYHFPFVKTILDGKEPQKPDFQTHLDGTIENSIRTKNVAEMKAIYGHLEKALGISLVSAHN